MACDPAYHPAGRGGRTSPKHRQRVQMMDSRFVVSAASTLTCMVPRVSALTDSGTTSTSSTAVLKRGTPCRGIPCGGSFLHWNVAGSLTFHSSWWLSQGQSWILGPQRRTAGLTVGSGLVLKRPSPRCRAPGGARRGPPRPGSPPLSAPRVRAWGAPALSPRGRRGSGGPQRSLEDSTSPPTR